METKQNDFTNWKKKIIKFLSGQTISLFGSFLVQYAIVWYITLETQSGVMATITILVSFLPQLLVSFFAGVWADKYNKKNLIMLSDGMIAVSTLILAILFLCGFRHLWLLFVIAAIRAVGSGMQSPAISSFIPDITPEDKLMRVNGIYTTIQSIMTVLAPVVSGALIANFNLEVIFFIDVFTAAIGIFLTYTIKYKKKEVINNETQEETSHLEEFKEGLRYIKEHKQIKRLFWYYAALAMLFTPIAFLTTLFVTRNFVDFGDAVQRMTIHETAFGIGAITGGAIIATWTGSKNRIHTIAFAGIGFGICGIGMGLSPNFIVYLVFMILSGICMPFFNTISVVYFQENVEPNLLRKSVWICSNYWKYDYAICNACFWATGRYN